MHLQMLWFMTHNHFHTDTCYQHTLSTGDSPELLTSLLLYKVWPGPCPAPGALLTSSPQQRLGLLFSSLFLFHLLPVLVPAQFKSFSSISIHDPPRQKLHLCLLSQESKIMLGRLLISVYLMPSGFHSSTVKFH